MRLSEEQINVKLDRYFDGNIKIDYSTYVDKASKARFVYQDNHESFWAKAENVWNGHGSAYRKSVMTSQRCRMSLSQVKDDLKRVHGDQVTIRDETYVCSSKRATFIDVDFGEWVAIVSTVRSGTGHPKRGQIKRRLTNLERYGVEYILQNKEIYDRAKKTRWNTVTIFHWKTGQLLECTASYEIAFVNWCNKNHIDFDWQIPHKMPDGRTYWIDAFIKDGEFANTWIEIKGWLMGTTKEKWEWFHAEHVNSDLWNKSRLIQLGILV